jgi:endonuclease/exonuclease/phosphatase family metal-dependent hydrolase
MNRSHAFVCRAVGVSLTTAFALSGCSPTTMTSPGVLSVVQQSDAIVIDGRRHDWADRANPIADERYLYLPIRVEGSSDPLQAMNESLVLLLDVDGNATTGLRADRPRAAATLGAELMVEFSPPGAKGPKRGVGVHALDANGAWTNISHADIGLVALPTHASGWFEVRIDRRLIGAPKVPLAGMRSVGRASGMWVLYDHAGEMVGWSDPFTVSLPDSRGATYVADVALPTKKPGEVRVVSYNVHGKMGANPEPFARMLDALDADILLLQEWNAGTGLTLETWLTANLSGGSEWRTVIGNSPDVAVAARGSVMPLGPGQILLGDSDRPVRFVGAVVETAAGAISVASVHFKCCGSAGGVEDARRLAEAEAVNRALGLALRESGTSMRFIGGDMNLVGSRRPIDLLRTGLDRDGTDMDVVEALVLGDASAATWSNDNGPFVPGRLDYAIVGDAGARVARSFVFDTRVLSDAALARIGLDRSDSAVSDHLPIVVDLVPKP